MLLPCFVPGSFPHGGSFPYALNILKNPCALNWAILASMTSNMSDGKYVKKNVFPNRDILYTTEKYFYSF